MTQTRLEDIKNMARQLARAAIALSIARDPIEAYDAENVVTQLVERIGVRIDEYSLEEVGFVDNSRHMRMIGDIVKIGDDRMRRLRVPKEYVTASAELMRGISCEFCGEVLDVDGVCRVDKELAESHERNERIADLFKE
jgi:hypothetical protein